MGRAMTSTFITELPLRVTPKQESTLQVRFEFARQLYNACLGEGFRRLDRMWQSKAYQSARYIPKGEDHKKERSQAFGEARKTYEFSDYGLQSYAATIKIGWIGSSVVQKVATRAFNSVSQYAFGKRGKPRYKGREQFDSVEGKQNTVLSWNDKDVVWGGMVLPAILPNENRKGNDVIQHGLQSPPKICQACAA